MLFLLLATAITCRNGPFEVPVEVKWFDGSPAAGVTFAARIGDLAYRTLPQITDTHGRATLELDQSSEIRLGGWGSRPRNQVVHGGKTLVFELPPRCHFRASVVGPTGDPVADVPALALVDPDGWPRSHVTLRSDAQGILEASVPCGPAMLGIDPPDPLAQERLTDLEFEPETNLEILLPEGVEVEGTVTKAGGMPVQNATIGEAEIAFARTRSAGRYRFRLDPSVPHILRFLAHGMEPTIIEVPVGEIPVRLDVTLKSK